MVIVESSIPQPELVDMSLSRRVNFRKKSLDDIKNN